MSFGVVAASYLGVIPPSGPMNIIGVAQDSRVGGGTLTLTPPAGAVSYIALCTGANYGGPNNSPTPPAGWMLLELWDNSWSRHAIYFANSLPGSDWNYDEDFSVQVTGYNQPLALPLQYGADVDLNDLLPAQMTPSPSITTTQPALIMRIFFTQPWNAAGPYEPVYPMAATLYRNYAGAPPDGGGDTIMLAAAYEVQSVAGATGVSDWTMNMGQRADNVGITLAVLPA